MYVTHRSFAAPAPAIRDFFWLYHTYSLLRGGFYNASSGFGLWAKPCGANKSVNNPGLMKKGKEIKKKRKEKKATKDSFNLQLL